MNSNIPSESPVRAEATVTTEELPGYGEWLDAVHATTPEPTPENLS